MIPAEDDKFGQPSESNPAAGTVPSDSGARDAETTEQLDPEVKARFLHAWDLREGELTDEQILIAIHTGHF